MAVPNYNAVTTSSNEYSLEPVPPASPPPATTHMQGRGSAVSSDEVDMMATTVSDLANQIVSLNEEIVTLRQKLREQAPRTIAPNPGWLEGLKMLKRPGEEYKELSPQELRVRLSEMTTKYRQAERTAVTAGAENDQLRLKLAAIQAEHQQTVEELRGNLNYSIAMRAREANQHQLELDYARQTYAAELAAAQNATAALIEREAVEWRTRMAAVERDLFDCKARLTGTEQRLEVRGEIIQALEAEKRSLRQLTWNGAKLIGSRVAKRLPNNNNRSTGSVHSLDEMVQQEKKQGEKKYADPTQDPNYFQAYGADC